MKKHDPFPPASLNCFSLVGIERINGFAMYSIRLSSGGVATYSYLEWKDFAKANSDKREYRDMERMLDEFVGLERSPPKLMAELAKGRVTEFFHDQNGTSFACIDSGGHFEIRPIRSQWFKDWLRKLCERATGKLASPDSIMTAMEHLAAIGRASKRRNLYVRVAWGMKNEEIFVDMANESWQAIRITKDGWETVDRPPIHFRRPDGMLPLCVPEKGGSMDEFLDCFNKEGVSPSEHLLFLARLMTIYIPQIAKAILVLAGDQGSGKTTYQIAPKQLLDPAIFDEQKPPSDKDQLTRDFANNLIVWYGNITKLDEDQQDSMCRGSTGGGFRKRRLYTDDEELNRRYKVAIDLNGINIAGSNPDFLDRVILLQLRRIPGDKLMGDDEWTDKLEKSLPSALGAVLDTLSKALLIYPDIILKEKYRLAAFCKWGEAVSQAMGNPLGRFMNAYGKNRRTVSKTAITLSPVGQAIQDFIDTSANGFFAGTASDLLKVLNEHVDQLEVKRDIEWPSNATKLSQKLNTIRLDLERAGINVNNDKNFDVRKARKKYPNETRGRLDKKSERTKVIVIQRAEEHTLEGLWNASGTEEDEEETESQT